MPCRPVIVCLLSALSVVFVTASASSATEPTAKAPERIYLSRLDKAHLEILAVPIDGGESSTLLSREGAFEGVSLSPARDLIAIKGKDATIKIVSVGKQEQFELPHTEQCVAPFFLRGKPWIVCTRIVVPKEKFQVEVHDYQKKTLVNSFDGEAPIQALADGTVFFVRNETETIIYRYDPATNVAQVAKKMKIEDGNHGVVEAVPVSSSQFFYQVAGEDWALWNDQADRELLPWDRGKHPHAVWQNNLVVDRAGTLAVFTESDAKDRPQLVAVDLKTKKVQRLSVRGLPLTIDEARMVFVNADTLWVYSWKTKQTRRLRELKGEIQLLP